MKFFKAVPVKATLLILIFFLLYHLNLFSLDGETMTKEKYLFEKRVSLNIDNEIQFEDGLKVTLKSFSHKRPYQGGPTKVMLDFMVSKGGVSEKITLSVHGVQGKSKSEDGLTESERYSSLTWNEYLFQLSNYDYGNSAAIVIKKSIN